MTFKNMQTHLLEIPLAFKLKTYLKTDLQQYLKENTQTDS